MSSNRLERDIFGGSDSELSSEEEDLQEERHERRRASPLPSAPRDEFESSGDSADDYVQEKRSKKNKIRRREEEEDRRPVQRKRKRKPVVEQDLDALPPEQCVLDLLSYLFERTLKACVVTVTVRKLQVQMKIDAIVKSRKNNRPKKRKKDAEEDVLDRFADEEVSQLREDMLRSAAEDDDANREKLPATSKLKLLPRVKDVLQKSSLAQSIMDNNLLEGVRRWLEPLPDRSLPALNIQAFFFEQLGKMDIDTNSLKESGLGRVVLFYTKCKRATSTISRMANELVSAWSRPIIKRSASYRDRLIPIAPDTEDASTQRAPERLNTILARAKENEKNRVRKNAVTIPTSQLGNYTIAPRANAGNMRNTASGNAASGPSPPADGQNPDKEKDKTKDQKKKWEPPVPTRVGKKKKRGPSAASKLPAVFPTTRCRLKLLKMERIKDYLLLEEEFIQNQERLKPEFAREEKNEEDRTKVDDLRGTPMAVGTLEEIIDDDHAIISTSSGPEFYVSIMSFVDKDRLEPGCSVLLHHKTQSIVGVLDDDADPMVSVMKLDKAPIESYADVGGLDQQIQEIKESVELPLTHPELYEEMGIKPPKGVILYGVPGTGKTLLAKAVANQTSATFLRVVGSELIQKYLGDGPKLVRELFRVAEEHAPSIVFIDEIDAIGTKRYESTSGGEREIQRTMLELLNQLDGFDTRGDVKVIMATNKIETLDPALIRPGRIDRKIEFPLPDVKTKRHIFKLHTSRMSLNEDVDLEEFVTTKDDLSGADIKAVCTEAGLLALRERRMRVTKADFTTAREKVLYRKNEGTPEGLYL
ncbi:hypothetical protein EW145_g5836 [Phellinidium pouzarii]|uniref:26S proteasome regulatory subunit 4 homolog n=1 Tax=Phellinidium pouzarii TaxID=167371 RepID=A0A4V3XC13_9AGAM|nr:hypothetical protein EW145_g5836 [Phellinidium pouzarii]